MTLSLDFALSEFASNAIHSPRCLESCNFHFCCQTSEEPLRPTPVSEMMSRADGLVQRRNVNRDTADGVSRENGQSVDNLDYEEDIDDGDSKETRLTLMEEVLLLGLKDKEVRYIGFIGRWFFFFVLFTNLNNIK